MIQRARVLCSAALLVALAGASLACQGPPRGAESTQPAAGAPAAGAGGQAPAGGAPAPAASGQAPAGPGGAAAPAPLKVRVSQPLDALSLASMYVARGNGYFADEGIEPEVITFSGGGPDVQALIAGDVEFNVTATTFLISAYKEGTP